MVEKLRVLMTADTVGGVFTYALSLAEALARHRVRTTLATMGARMRPDQAQAARRVPGLDVIESEFALEWAQDPWHDVDRAGDWLLRLERDHAPDIVHLNGYCHGALPWRAPALVVAHSCVLSWWRAVWGEQAPPRYARYRAEVARGLHAARAVVAPTRAMLAAIHEHYGRPHDDVVIPNGCNHAPPLGAPKEPFILAAGRIWDEAKNLAALARIAPRLPWPVYVAGPERHPDGSFRTLPCVRSLGWLAGPDLLSWMSRASLFVAPARYEPFGLSALEAAAQGCALILGDIPSLREVWGDAALYVPPDDDRALEAAIARLIEDAELRASLARRAFCRALRFDVAEQAAQYLNVYRSLGLTRAREGSQQPCA